jgi:two-component system, OmpR family, sensor histidine kinase KdpD
MTRPRAEDFIELIERLRRGRLKVYIAFAAGVGKTYRMLEEAHALAKRGVDVVIGLVEPHGRADTAALIHGLEVIPRRVLDYRGMRVEEMDLDAILARRPKIVLVDEVAHTNLPGSRHAKRYEDVYALLDAGINVICAFNVQHLESLQDLVAEATGVAVRETVPDTFLEQADQVVNLDLAVEDLLDRLRAGKIYPPEKIRRALENFFREDKLSALRELALREVAESLGRAALAKGNASDAEPGAPRLGSGRVMVCISSRSPAAAALLRRGSRLAGRLNTEWYVVYVEAPSESPERIDSVSQRILLANIQKARELGAEVLRLRGRDVVATLLEFARSHAVAHILIGRPLRRGWRSLLLRDFVQRMVREADDFDLYICSRSDSAAPS